MWYGGRSVTFSSHACALFQFALVSVSCLNSLVRASQPRSRLRRLRCQSAPCPFFKVLPLGAPFVRDVVGVLLLATIDIRSGLTTLLARSLTVSLSCESFLTPLRCIAPDSALQHRFLRRLLCMSRLQSHGAVARVSVCAARRFRLGVSVVVIGFPTASSLAGRCRMTRIRGRKQSGESHSG